MAEEEYFVRKPDSDNARGPFSIDKLLSLVEAGQIDRQTLVYEAESESWKPIGDNASLAAAIFPEKRKLTLRRRATEAAPADEKAPSGRPAAAETAEPKPEAAPAAEKLSDTPPATKASRAPDKTAPTAAAPVQTPPPAPEPPMERLKPELSGMKVDDILAAAEGDTEEMDQIRRDRKWVERAISIALPMMALALLVSAVSLLGTRGPDIVTAWKDGFGWNWLKLLEDPKLVLGLVDLVMALALALAATSVYLILRIRLMVGLGYLGYSAFAAHLAGSATGAYELLALGIFCLCVFVCTVTIRFTYMLVCGLAAIASAAALGIIWNFPKLLA